MIRLKKQVIGWILAIASVTAFPTFADEKGDTVADTVSDEDAARTAFGEATALYNDGKYDESLKRFESAYSLKPSWKLYYNIGQAAVAARRQGVAIAAFEKYLAQGGDEIPMTRRDEVLKEIDRLRMIVGSIDLQAPDGFTIEIDGFPRGTTPLVGRLRVSASLEHEIVLKNGDAVVDSKKIIVGGRESITVRLGDGNVSKRVDSVETGGNMTEAARANIVHIHKRKARNFRTAGWVTLGAGGGIAVLGLLGLAAAKKDKDDNDATNCTNDPDPDCETKLEKSIQETDDTRKRSIGALVIGLAAMAVSPVLFYNSKKHENLAQKYEQAIIPQMAPGYSGFMYQVSF